MPRKSTNQLLQNAKRAKSDEFYTQLCDIERELVHYKSCFNGKVVYCNCDDPRVSNFVKYFITNFHALGLKKLIASCYVQNEIDLFSSASFQSGYYFEYYGEDLPNNDVRNIKLKSLKGDGDFRSLECIELLKQSDIVVTNPPFSLFREFVCQLVRYNKHFLIIGNINAITYKEVFTLIQNNKAWLGVNLGRGISGFIVPPEYDIYGTEVAVNTSGQTIISTNNCLWLTNLAIASRFTRIKLTKTYKGNESKYPKYDNCFGINVDRTQDIPMDYFGLMGVPITFLHKYNPAQFEIIRFRKGDDGKDLCINGKCPYFRILIRHNRQQLQQYSPQ